MYLKNPFSCEDDESIKLTDQEKEVVLTPEEIKLRDENGHNGNEYIM